MDCYPANSDSSLVTRVSRRSRREGHLAKTILMLQQSHFILWLIRCRNGIREGTGEWCMTLNFSDLYWFRWIFVLMEQCGNWYTGDWYFYVCLKKTRWGLAGYRFFCKKCENSVVKSQLLWLPCFGNRKCTIGSVKFWANNPRKFFIPEKLAVGRK